MANTSTNKEGESDQKVVCRNFRHTTQHGAIVDKTKTNGVIISVSYRVKSQQDTQFRIWATQRSREGDTCRKKMYQPLAFKVMGMFLKVGFILKEDIIKRQFNCKATGLGVTKSKEHNFLLLMHEHLFIFQKCE